MSRKTSSTGGGSSSSNRKGPSSMSSPSTPVVASPSSPDLIISKIILHSRNKGSPKFLKYLSQAKRSFSSSNLKLWMDLRTKGGIHAIETVIRSLSDEEFLFCNDNQPNDAESKNKCSRNKSNFHNQKERKESKSYAGVRTDTCIAGLSMLGNSYSVDFTARKEVASTGFIEVLHKFIQNSLNKCITGNNTVADLPPKIKSEKHELSAVEITTRAVKCIANLSHDSNCRDIVLKSGVAISVLKILEGFDKMCSEDNNSAERNCQNLKEGKDPASATPPIKKVELLKDEHKECIRASVRAIRILSSEPFCSEEAKSHLIRFGAVITIGKFLSWSGDVFPRDELTLDIIRALTSLTDKVRLLYSEQIDQLVYEESGNMMLKNLVGAFENSSTGGKLFSPSIRCLTNLACNTRIAESLGRLLVFRIALEKLKQTSGKASVEICRLLVVLTKHSSVNQHVLNNCQEIWSTLNILKSSDLQEYHRWVLHVYEHVYEGSLKSLIRSGLIELIHDHLKEELEDCDYEVLKKKIMSLEDDSCKVHIHRNGCQFAPVYRCDSPSYQQVQEEVKELMRDRDTQNKMDIESSSSGVDSSSPSSSPARSWTSEDSIPIGGSEIGSFFSARSSASSDDEGCYSPVYSFASSPTTSNGSPERDIVVMSDEENPREDSFSEHQAKRLRLDSSSESFSIMERQRSRKPSENIKLKSKIIVSMLNILHKTTYLTPMPQNLVQVIPMLLSFIVRGIVSLTPQKDKYQQSPKDLESLSLGRQSFSLAYRILKTMCLNITMFPEFVKNGTVSIVFRLLTFDKLLDGLQGNQSMRLLLSTLSGLSNDTAGWREGYLLRTLLISKCEDELNKIALAIPLLFRKNDHVLRSFETKGNCWSRVFELLTKTDDINFSKFQDCILSITSLCETIGMRWTEIDTGKYRPLLLNPQQSRVDLNNLIIICDKDNNNTSLMDFDGNDDKRRVELTLDDGSRVFIPKNVLTEASPVFSAMFDGHFIEAGQQKVRIRDKSKEAVRALTEQIILLKQDPGDNNAHPISSVNRDQYELSTLFELISLSDQFLLEDLYERTLSSLLNFYICPYSAPLIYVQAVKLSALWKPQSRLNGGQLDLTYTILKYLLVGDISMNSRCGAFRKIFDSVSPSIVVGDMRALIEFYCSQPLIRRESRGN